jgi:hypothetical protein
MLVTWGGWMNKWEIVILKIMAANGGTVSLRNVYDELPNYIDLTTKHCEITYRAPAYHHQTRAHIDDLLDKGELIRTNRGVYSITSKGRLRIGVK